MAYNKVPTKKIKRRLKGLQPVDDEKEVGEVWWLWARSFQEIPRNRSSTIAKEEFGGCM